MTYNTRLPYIANMKLRITNCYCPLQPPWQFEHEMLECSYILAHNQANGAEESPLVKISAT